MAIDVPLRARLSKLPDAQGHQPTDGFEFDCDRTAARAAQRRTQLTCKSWGAEAALRVLMNNLGPEVAEDPANLVAQGGSGEAVRDWPSPKAIVATLRRSEAKEARLVYGELAAAVARVAAPLTA